MTVLCLWNKHINMYSVCKYKERMQCKVQYILLPGNSLIITTNTQILSEVVSLSPAGAHIIIIMDF